MIGWLKILIVGVVFCGSLPIYATNSCNALQTASEIQSLIAVQETFEGQLQSYRRIVLNHTGLIPTTNIPANRSASSVYVGIDFSGHTYLVVGKVRIDPSNLYGAATVHAHTRLLKPGIIFELEVGQDNVKAAEAALRYERNYGSFNCVTAVCSLLKKHLELRFENDSRAIRPETLIRNLLQNAMLTENGNKVAHQLFVISINPDETLASSMKSIHLGANDVVGKDILIAMMGSGVGYVALRIILAP